MFLHDNAPSRSRFLLCLVNEALFFFRKNLTAHCLEDLLSLEQQTNFIHELADALAQGLSWLFM